MAGRFSITEFAKDYCAGVRDKDLRAKYRLNPAEMVQLVKKLLTEGTVTREQYHQRRQRIAELEISEEKDFLKSLYVCPVCSHMHPTPFIRCPACGNDSSEYKAKKGRCETLPQKFEQEAIGKGSDARYELGGPGLSLTVGENSETSEVAVSSATEASDAKLSALREVPITSARQEAPEGINNLVGLTLADLSFLLDRDAGASGEQYRITELINNDARSAIFKAENSSKRSSAVRVRLFHPGPAGDGGVDRLIDQVFLVQCNMEDPNIIRIIGKATLDGRLALLYEHMPYNMEILVTEERNGLPIDLLRLVLPQVLNGVGYMHLHRGRDGANRRLPHLNLKPSNILIDKTMKVVKIDDAGVSRSLVEVRGHKTHMWEEPAIDLGALCPEAFVLESRYVNGIQADIYALGILLYRMATGKAPFIGSNLEEYRFAHTKTYAAPPKVHRYDLPLWLDEMILKCLEKEPEKRWRSATQMELSIGKRLAK